MCGRGWKGGTYGSDANLVFTTYFGDSGSDTAWGVAVDRFCDIHLGGTASESPGFPLMNPIEPGPAGAHNGFVAKLDASGSRLLFSSLLGGSGFDAVLGVAADPDGNTIVVGQTDSADFPTVNAAQPVFGGAGPAPTGYNGDAFVAKIDTRRSRLVYSTFLGGGHIDEAYAVTVDAEGNAYVTGYTASDDFPTVAAHQSVFGGGDPFAFVDGDAFVTKLNAAGQLVWSTYLGGSVGEHCTGIALDGLGNVFVSGVSKHPFFPLVDPLPTDLVADEQVFVTKFASDGASVLMSTFVSNGGAFRPGGYRATGVAVDASGAVYVSGAVRAGRLEVVGGLRCRRRCSREDLG